MQKSCDKKCLVSVAEVDLEEEVKMTKILIVFSIEILNRTSNVKIHLLCVKRKLQRTVLLYENFDYFQYIAEKRTEMKT